ncbi:MAG: hypothetical protein PHE70_07950 [Tepidanaerobacteraceae bacterium]|nr:hypothetical protein [Tepidanaerobacteraceae bacterium]
MSSLILYLVTVLLFVLSYITDKDKTKKAFLKGCKSLTNMMPQFLGIIFIVGITLALLKPETISRILGSSSGAFGVLLSAVLGSIAMMPTFVAFSTGDMLLKSGAGIAQVAALISTLTLIGIITIPMESKYIGKRATLYRNIVAFFFSIIVGFLLKEVIEIL